MKRSYFFIFLFSVIIFSLNVYRNQKQYTTDSLFYEHMFYQFQGKSFEKSRELVLENHPQSKESKMFIDESEYKNAYSFFKKRPFYPFLAFQINRVINNKYLSFLIPVFVSYLAFILISYYFFYKSFSLLFALLSASLLFANQNLLIWSRTFMTDLPGASLWMFQKIRRCSRSKNTK